MAGLDRCTGEFYPCCEVFARVGDEQCSSRGEDHHVAVGAWVAREDIGDDLCAVLDA